MGAVPVCKILEDNKAILQGQRQATTRKQEEKQEQSRARRRTHAVRGLPIDRKSVIWHDKIKAYGTAMGSLWKTVPSGVGSPWYGEGIEANDAKSAFFQASSVNDEQILK